MGAIFGTDDDEEKIKFNLFSELNENIFNIIEVLGIHFTFRSKFKYF